MAAAKDISVEANILIFIRTGQHLLTTEGAKNVSEGFSLLLSGFGHSFLWPLSHVDM